MQHHWSPDDAPRREPELDGLRAIAATMVLLFHCLSAVGISGGPLQERLLMGLPGALANGTSAVILFFVLSGYVLTGSCLRDRSAPGAAGFLLRRVLRLYPAYLAGLALAWLVTLVVPLFEHGAGESPWVRVHGDLRLGMRELFLSALMPGSAFGLIPVGWSLRLELLYSMAFPALLWLALRTHVGLLVLAAGIGVVLTDSRLLHYAFPFTAGMAMYLHRDRVRLRHSLPVAARWSLLAGAAAAFFLPALYLWPHSRLVGMGVSTLGACVLMLLARLAPLRAILASRFMVRAGEISYSLYLIHVPVVLLASPFLLTQEPAGDAGTAAARWLLLSAVVLPTALMVSALSYRWVEAPGMEAGRRLGGRRDAASTR